MAEAFRGEFYQKVDAKGRVSIPAAFRRILESDDPPSTDFPRPRVYMIYGGANRNFVECYTKAGADALADEISLMDEGSDEREQVEFDLLSCSVMVEVEPDGRIVLPPRVREKVGLAGADFAGDEAAFQGRNNRFRLYRRDTYDSAVAQRPNAGLDALALLGRAKKERGM
jgi:MraZ protein